jgi:hypothetical protein
VERAEPAQEPWDVLHPQQVTFGGEITLLGYQPAVVQVRSGESVLLETHWRAETTPAAEYAMQIELVDKEGQVAASWLSTPSVGGYPTSQWRPGEYVRGQLPLSLPGTLAPGDYRLKIGLVAADGTPLAAAGAATRPARLRGAGLEAVSVEVLDRPRRFEMPTAPFPLEATIGQQAHLVGYDLDLSQAKPNGQLLVTLYWQAGGPMVMPFKVFTHLVDSENHVLAQHDGAPGGGCCPANTWAEGEVIVDEHVIDLGADLGPGTYELVVGMYDEESWSRVAAYDAPGKRLVHDQVPIRPVTIEATSMGQGVATEGTAQEPVSVRTRAFPYRVFLPLVVHTPGRE